MYTNTLRKILLILGVLVALWLGLRYLLPLLLPFLLGGLLALSAEPAVRFGIRKLRLSRPAAAGLGVGLTLVLLLSLVWLVGALAVKELGSLSHALPDVQATVDQGMYLLQDWAVRLAEKLPEGARTAATDAALTLLDGDAVLKGQVTGRLPGLLRSVLQWLPGGVLSIGTAVLAAFMVSSRLPRLRWGLQKRLPESYYEKFLPALGRMGHNVLAWLKAQLKLSAVTYGIVALGFLILGIPYGFFWAVLVALVDAVPVLGTGTVLLPWALIELIGDDRIRALGLVVIYGAAMLTRTVLEPRLVGRHLGLDPLLTLLCLYVGYRLWGIPGMLLAPMLTAAVKGLTGQKPQADTKQ